MGDEDNWWGMGDTGPCGPDSEIFIDKGPSLRRAAAGPSSGARSASSRCGTWSSCSSTGRPTARLTDLPHKNIDTGAGFERILPILQGHDSVFDTDLFVPIIERGGLICGVPYGRDERTDVALRVMADHGRAMSMLVADGVLPANEGRGYVLRRVVRRAVLAARRLGVDKPVGPTLVRGGDRGAGRRPGPPWSSSTTSSSTWWPARRPASTARCGPGWAGWRRRSPPARRCSAGDVAFTLHDTHGFPVELTEELARDAGVEVDRAGFDAAMAEQRERARAAARPAKVGDESSYRAPARRRGPDPLRRALAAHYEVPARIVGACWPGDRAGTWSRSSWTRRRSTPRAGDRSATPGPSSPRPGSPTSSTPCTSCPDWSPTGPG